MKIKSVYTKEVYVISFESEDEMVEQDKRMQELGIPKVGEHVLGAGIECTYEKLSTCSDVLLGMVNT
ncbi:hypothetical protein [Bacillus mycoides]|uniref:hypothetical protein n=1 Tax=Bacillus mycoides TaxID=1405 RepID=UPI003A813545